MHFSSRRNSMGRRASRRSQESEQKETTPTSKTKLIESEDNATGSVAFGVYLRYFKNVGWPFSITILIFNAINQSMAVTSNCKWLNNCVT